jgi:hypothetical protein
MPIHNRNDKEIKKNNIVMKSSFDHNLLKVDVINRETFGPQPYFGF